MRWCETAYGLNYVALRYFNVAGARSTGEIGEDHTPETHLVPLVLEVANNQRPVISIYGDDYATEDGTCVRDYIHVEDLIDAHVLALDYLKQGNPSDVFNLGSSRGFSVREIIEAARRVTGHAIPEQVVARRAGDPSTLIAGSDKAKTVLGWNPSRTDIETIIQDAWRWHEQRPQGYKTPVR